MNEGKTDLNEERIKHWDNWAESVFQSCLNAIKVLHPKRDINQWRLMWKLIEVYQSYREEVADDE